MLAELGGNLLNLVFFVELFPMEISTDLYNTWIKLNAPDT
jgi:hypothetical protein